MNITSVCLEGWVHVLNTCTSEVSHIIFDMLCHKCHGHEVTYEYDV